MITKNKIYKSIALMSLVCLGIANVLQSCETKENKNSEKETREETKISQIEIDINKAIEGAYKVWYVKKGDHPDFSKYENYYTSNAIFQEFKKDTVIVSLISDGVNEFKDAFKAGHLFSFDEREIGSETTYFGNVAHRISYHIYHTNTTDSITKRGTNSIRLVKINGKWKTQSILRQIESDNYQLPKKYDSFRSK